MTYTIRLDLYYFNLYRITKKTSRKMRDGVRSGYKTEDCESPINEVLKSITNKSDNDDTMKLFVEKFINDFNGTFVSNKNGTQAISITTDLYKGFDSGNNTVWGAFIGGATGKDYDVYRTTDAKQATGKIDRNSVASLKYFYKIWFPSDSNIGLLMIQSYSTASCTSLFKSQFEQYLISAGYKPKWSKCIPKKLIDDMLNHGCINKVKVLYADRDTDKPFDPIFKPFKSCKKESTFSKLSITLAEFLILPNREKMLKSAIQAVDMNFNEDNDSVKLTYSYNGKTATALLGDVENIVPTLKLDEDFIDNITSELKWNEIHFFTNQLLDEIKQDIGYTPKSIK